MDILRATAVGKAVSKLSKLSKLHPGITACDRIAVKARSVSLVHIRILVCTDAYLVSNSTSCILGHIACDCTTNEAGQCAGCTLGLFCCCRAYGVSKLSERLLPLTALLPELNQATDCTSCARHLSYCVTKELLLCPKGCCCVQRDVVVSKTLSARCCSCIFGALAAK